jgi:ADP-ribose pyrophosphatase YjhB (NUDIX family)
VKFCSNCGQPLERLIPPGDQRLRAVCAACGTVHYENPKIVVGCVPEWEGRILLCRRAIEPRLGYWTTPAGYLEIGETLRAAAARETHEEALAQVEIGSLLAVVEVLHSAQVHVMFRARMLSPACGAGTESLEVMLCEEAQIPWSDIAFQSITFSLRRYLEDRRAGREPAHFEALEHRLPISS